MRGRPSSMEQKQGPIQIGTVRPALLIRGRFPILAGIGFSHVVHGARQKLEAAYFVASCAASFVLSTALSIFSPAF